MQGFAAEVRVVTRPGAEDLATVEQAGSQATAGRRERDGIKIQVAHRACELFVPIAMPVDDFLQFSGRGSCAMVRDLGRNIANMSATCSVSHGVSLDRVVVPPVAGRPG
ncbi:hypothetical protein ACIP6P_32720 [Streptomyces sp. NPDC088729]|uniref:hypothetical protein n=1 Tax=Streptomyces sp. NPDC088729 TaxID=3365876 RepID=UPI0037F85816